jgi:hypothetical protein
MKLSDIDGEKQKITKKKKKKKKKKKLDYKIEPKHHVD